MVKGSKSSYPVGVFFYLLFVLRPMLLEKYHEHVCLTHCNL